MEQLNQKIGEFTPDNLIGGDEFSLILKGITLAKGQGVLNRGTVVGKVTAVNVCKPVDKTKTDGTEKPYCILTDTVDTGDETATEDFLTTGYFTGVFNKNALIFGGTDTAEDHEDTLREIGIFLKDNIKY